MADGKINWYTDVVIKFSKPCCLRWTSQAKLFKVSIRAKLFKVNIKARLFKAIMLQSLPTEGVCTNIGRTAGGRSTDS